MVKQQAFLVLGKSTTDVNSLNENGLKVANFYYPIVQCKDEGDEETAPRRVRIEDIKIVLSQLPPQHILEWGLQPGKYEDGMIVVLDNENTVLGKFIFQNATCAGLDINYTRGEEGFCASTELNIRAKKLIIGEIEFDNEWAMECNPDNNVK